MRDWDYIIVGAGSSGCALAYELAHSGRHRVLLIESGGSDRSLAIKVPALIGHIDRRCDWGYVSQPDSTRAGRCEKWQRGHVLGGSSSVNGMIYVRGAAQDFDRWASMGNSGWSYAEVLPLFQDMERSDQSGETRGHHGRLHVRTVRHPHPLTKAFVDSAVAAGFAFNPDYNAGSQEGIAYAQLSQRHGLRWSAADAFIRPLEGKRNFKLLLDAHVDRIHFQGKRAVHVEVAQAGHRERLSGRRIVVCAGAINTPAVLMRSGIGDATELEALGIPVIVNAPTVGRNLREHSLLRLIYKTRIQSHNLTGGLLQKIKIAGEFLLHRGGPIGTAIEAVGFLRTSPDQPHPDVQVHFVTLGITAFYGESRSPFLDSPSVTVYVNKSHPQGQGRIRLASANPHDPPKIECHLLASDCRDLETLERSVALVRTIMAAQPISDWVTEEVTPGPHYRSAEALREYVPAHTEVAYHPIGTCRMGTDAGAVVSPKLAVHGVENLWVADASVMPDLISGNTNAACMMIGLKLGRGLDAQEE